MSSYYALKAPERVYFIYRTEDGALICRHNEKGRLSPEVCLLDGARKHFTAALRNGEPVLFCQDEEGNTLMFAERGGEWFSRPARHNPGCRDMLITPMFGEHGMYIIHNEEEGDGKYLCGRHTNEKGVWQPALRIDAYLPLYREPYEAQATSASHTLLFYQSGAGENLLGYREITPTRFGPYQRIHSGKNIMDASFLTTEDAVFALFVVRSVFSSQLLFRYRAEAAFSAPLLLWEAPKIDDVLLMFINGKLYATCVSGNRLYTAISENRGASFSKMDIYKGKFCFEPAKAAFAASVPQREDTLFARQIYIDRNAPWDAQMTPEMYEKFYE